MAGPSGAENFGYKYLSSLSVERTQAAKNSETFTALDAGADNTGTTSATAALTKLKQYIVTESGGTTTSNDKAVCVVIPPGKYKVDGFGVDWSDLRNNRGVHIIAYGATFIGETDGYPVIDAIDSRWLNVYGLQIIGDETSMPRCGIQIGKRAVATVGNTCLSNVTVSGFFSLAAYFNHTCANKSVILCRF